MYASVVFEDGEKSIVPIENIRNFNPNNFDKRKKYNILWEDGNYYDGVVLLVKASKEDVESALGSKRLPIPKFTLCKDSSNLSESVDKADDKTVSNGKSAKNCTLIQTLVEKRIAAVGTRKVLQENKRKPSVVSTEQIAVKLKKTQVNTSKGIANISRKTKSSDILKDDIGNSELAALSNKENISKTGKEKTVNSKLSPDSSQKEKVDLKRNTSSEVNASRAGSTTGLDVSKDDIGNRKSAEMPSNENSSKTGKEKTINSKLAPDSSQKEKVDLKRIHASQVNASRGISTISNKRPASSEDPLQLTKENTRLKEANVALKKLCEDQKKTISQQQTELDDLRCLNTDSLQIVRDMKQRNNETFTRGGGFPPIGYENPTKQQTHIGKGFYLPSCQFATLMTNKSPSLFVKEMARVVFGKPVLLKSTVTGKESNRAKKNRILQGLERPLQLDPKKLSCIQESLQFFLDDARFSKLGSVAKQTHVYKVGCYVGEYISDLKKVAKKALETKTTGEDSTKIGDNDEISDDGAENHDRAETPNYVIDDNDDIRTSGNIEKNNNDRRIHEQNEDEKIQDEKNNDEKSEDEKSVEDEFPASEDDATDPSRGNRRR